MKFYVENQTIIPDGVQPKMVSNSQDFVACRFRFGESWDGLTKVALFAQSENVYTQLLDEAYCCMLPVEIQAGQCGISVYGADGEETTTATSNSYLVNVIQAGYYGEAIVPTPDLYSQLLATIDSLLKGEPGQDGVLDAINGEVADAVAVPETDETSAEATTDTSTDDTSSTQVVAGSILLRGSIEAGTYWKSIYFAYVPEEDFNVEDESLEWSSLLS